MGFEAQFEHTEWVAPNIYVWTDSQRLCIHQERARINETEREGQSQNAANVSLLKPKV